MPNGLEVGMAGAGPGVEVVSAGAAEPLNVDVPHGSLAGRDVSTLLEPSKPEKIASQSC